MGCTLSLPDPHSLPMRSFIEVALGVLNSRSSIQFSDIKHSVECMCQKKKVSLLSALGKPVQCKNFENC